MAATSRSNAELQRKAKLAQGKAKDPIEKLRLACLSRGASGIKGLGRYRIYYSLLLLLQLEINIYRTIRKVGLFELGTWEEVYYESITFLFPRNRTIFYYITFYRYRDVCLQKILQYQT